MGVPEGAGRSGRLLLSEGGAVLSHPLAMVGRMTERTSTQRNPTPAGETATDARLVRKVVHCGGVRGVLVNGPSGWRLENEDEARTLAAMGAPGWALARFRALAATLDAGLVAVSDLGQLNRWLNVIATRDRRLARYVWVPGELESAVAYACACLSDWNGSEWLAWALAERLDGNLFEGWPLHLARTPDDPHPLRTSFGLVVESYDLNDSVSSNDDDMPASFWERLRTHVEPRLRAVAAASDPLTTRDKLEELAESDDAAVLHSVASHPNTPAEVLRRIAESSWLPDEARCAVARNKSISPRLLRTLAKDPSEDVRSVAAAHPATPAAVLAVLSDDWSVEVRVSVVLHPSTPEHVLIEAATDDHPAVPRHAARNPWLPASALERLLRASFRGVRADAVLHPSTSLEMAIPLATDRSLQVRRMVAFKPGMPAEILKRLARDPKPRVRAAVAWNNNTPATTMAALTSDDEALVRAAVAASPVTGKATLIALTGDADDKVRAEATGNLEKRLDPGT